MSLQAAPRVQVLGVYKLPVTDDLALMQSEITGGRLQDAHTLLNSVVLIELMIVGRDARYDAGDFTQPFTDRPRSDWPAPYCETYLTPDGEAVIDFNWPHPPPGDLRIAFYLHDWDPAKPLQTSYGNMICPKVQPMPERLQRLVPFELYD